MKKNKKLNVLLSSAAIVTMLSTMGVPNVLAADRDIRDLKTGKIVVTEDEYKSDLSKRNRVLLNWDSYGFELGNKVYTLGDTNEVWKTDKTMESIPEALKDKVQIDLNEELKVESVSAINATTVEVKFSVAVDKNDVETNYASLFDLDGNNPTAAELSEDGKTATLTFASGNVEVKSKVFVVEPVKVDADNNTEKYTEIFTYEDKVKPEVTKVEALTSGTKATTATVTFSEPIASAAAIKMNGKVLASGTDYTAIVGGETKLVLNNLDLDATKTHTLEILQLADQASTPNVNSYIKETFTVKVDKVAPKLVSVENVTDKGLKLVFSKPVDFANVVNNKATDVIKVVDKVAVDDKTFTLFASKVFTANADKTEYTADFNDLSTVLGSETEVTLTVQTIKDAFIDLAGNKIGLNEKEITLKADEVKPQILSATAKKDKDGKVAALVFNFDKKVDKAAGASITNVNDLFATNALNTETKVQKAVTDILGTTNAVTKSVSTDGKTITYTLATEQTPSGSYEFEVKKDIFEDKAATPNKNKATKVTINFGEAVEDETYLTVPSVSSSDDNTNVITVTYTEAVKAGLGKGSAVDASSYKLNGAALPQGTTLTIDSDQKVVTITLPEGVYADTDTASAFIVVKDVESKDGKMTLKEEVLEVIQVTDNVKPEAAAVLNADGTITVELSEKLNTDKIVAADTTTFLAGDLKLSFEGINLTNTVQVGDHNVTVVKQTSGPLKGKYILEVTENGTLVDLNEVTDLKLETKATTASDDDAGNLLKEKVVLIEK